ncbi:hypothetical protein I302_101300 [Kwoniella bestiolae CBS 10118]|uniref:Uncharacterized protein n=1 Tax=Kwoniella bestiolae CBS 10118 TaxID=1296100 RepID=A0A1B9G7J4_9TREE|nr:hypothetical protein I302_04674 [Kwoniella bestiolae CBS 10118]OCF26982.1 hypothetical protein I302_04674 [Kwoniella bestiolae CBS 10118]
MSTTTQTIAPRSIHRVKAVEAFFTRYTSATSTRDKATDPASNAEGDQTAPPGPGSEWFDQLASVPQVLSMVYLTSGPRLVRINRYRPQDPYRVMFVFPETEFMLRTRQDAPIQDGEVCTPSHAHAREFEEYLREETGQGRGPGDEGLRYEFRLEEPVEFLHDFALRYSQHITGTVRSWVKEKHEEYEKEYEFTTKHVTTQAEFEKPYPPFKLEIDVDPSLMINELLRYDYDEWSHEMSEEFEGWTARDVEWDPEEEVHVITLDPPADHPTETTSDVDTGDIGEFEDLTTAYARLHMDS